MADMNQLVLSETTRPGTVVYTLLALSSNQQNQSDETSTAPSAPLQYYAKGSDVFSIDSSTGEVTLIKALDREVKLSIGPSGLELKYIFLGERLYQTYGRRS